LLGESATGAWGSSIIALLGAPAETVLNGPRARMGPPWTKDHRVALAATIIAG
jgi:hypothetical protein